MIYTTALCLAAGISQSAIVVTEIYSQYSTSVNVVMNIHYNATALGYSSNADAYAALTTQLNNNIVSGTFTVSLNAYAVTFSVVDLEAVTCPSGSYSYATPSALPTKTPTLGPGMTYKPTAVSTASAKPSVSAKPTHAPTG